jgi:hypothetical protein
MDNKLAKGRPWATKCLHYSSTLIRCHFRCPCLHSKEVVVRYHQCLNQIGIKGSASSHIKAWRRLVTFIMIRYHHIWNNKWWRRCINIRSKGRLYLTVMSICRSHRFLQILEEIAILLVKDSRNHKFPISHQNVISKMNMTKCNYIIKNSSLQKSNFHSTNILTWPNNLVKTL